MAALAAEAAGTPSYEFASERDEVARRVGLEAWGGHGLTEARCHADAREGAATEESSVDV